jgi:hypothetical protein
MSITTSAVALVVSGGGEGKALARVRAQRLGAARACAALEPDHLLEQAIDAGAAARPACGRGVRAADRPTCWGGHRFVRHRVLLPAAQLY